MARSLLVVDAVHRAVVITAMSALASCHVGGEGGRADATAASADAGTPDGAPAADASTGCPGDMAPVGEACMDRYEAPNVEGAVPLVMYTFDEAAAWCGARGKRLCFDDEWQAACEGAAAAKFPYGDTHQPGTCNDDEVWRTYDQTLLNGWPWNVSSPEVESLQALLEKTRAVSSAAAAAADHIEALYQGEAAGQNPGCASEYQVFDLVGNVEEWTRRRDGGTDQFHGNLKGRYWAESRTCQSGVTNHGDGFRFYEIGFRCCAERLELREPRPR